jgi:chromosome segregation ATPase
MSGEPEFNKYLANHLTLLLDGMKGLNARIAQNVQAMDRYDIQFAKLSRFNMQFQNGLIDIKVDLGQLKSEFGQLRGEFGQFRSSIELRLDAILHRLDALESEVHDNTGHIRELRADGLSQYNEILNALQDGHQNRMSLSDLADRVSELERLAGRLPPPAA